MREDGAGEAPAFAKSLGSIYALRPSTNWATPTFFYDDDLASQGTSIPVSYTHLTLPTKRIV